MAESIQTQRVEYKIDSFKVDLPVGTRLDGKAILDFITKHKMISQKWVENDAYYNGLNTYILNKRLWNISESSPDNRIATPKARSLVDTISGYMFTPGYIKYNSENKELLEIINNIFYENYESTVDYNIGVNMSKYGIAYEIMYTGFDENGSAIPCFNLVSPRQIFFIYNYNFDENQLCAVRYYDVRNIAGELTPKIEVYYKDEILTYNMINNNLMVVDSKKHYFGQIPVIEYWNNDELYAEYEIVKSLIDAKDMLLSSVLDETQKLALAYLILKGYKIDDDSLESIRSRRVFENIDSDGDVKFLTKDINPQFLEFVDQKIEKEIERATHIPDFTDKETFGNSGVALSYKLLPFDYLCTKKESYAKKGLQKRIELILNFLKKSKGIIGLKSEFDIIFVRNLPANYIEAVDVIAKGRGNIPLSTLLLRYPDIKDIQSAIEELKSEEDIEPLDEMIEMPEEEVEVVDIQ